MDTGWRARLYEIIFEHDAWAGKAFDVALLWSIVLSVLAVMLESVASIRADYGTPLRWLEWAFTILFTAEYVLRLACVPSPRRYALSFFGIVDLMAVAPTYLSLLLPGTQSLLVIRAIRLLRVFRVLKLGHYLREAEVLNRAIRSSGQKITVFLSVVLIVVVVIGAMMHVIEGEANGFTSIPRSVYWAIVTMTTVGYGDIAPQTVVGQILASVLMITGYGVIAVPTGIVTVELGHAVRSRSGARTYGACGETGHDVDARHCKYCGNPLGAIADQLVL